MNDQPTMPDVDDGETVVVHILPHVSAKHAGDGPRSYLAPAAKVREQIAEGHYDVRTLVTPTRPIEGHERTLNVRQMYGWLEAAEEMARAEGGSGLLMGYDPLRPDRRSGNSLALIGMTTVVDHDNDANPLFAWDEVAAFSANRGSPTAEIYLTDGRAVFIHADVDWTNRLS